MSGEPERLLCAECRWCVRNSSPRTWLCERPEIEMDENPADLAVLGLLGAVPSPPRRLNCYLERQGSTMALSRLPCGPQGRYFTPNEKPDPPAGSILIIEPEQPRGGVLTYLRALFS